MYNKNEKKNKKGSFSFIKLFIIINCFCYNLELFGAVGYCIRYIKKQIEIEKVESYFNFCNEYETKTIKPFDKVINPKISVVVPIFNRDRYIVRFLRCIQHQSFEDIEIIFIDDNSVDNGVDMLEEYRNVDKRIVLLKNMKNRGSFMSRNIGVLNARGKYVIIPDPDDILYKNILSTCYNFAEKYNYDMLRFAMYTGAEKNDGNEFINRLESRPIFQPELSTYLFYEKNELLMTDVFINNKFVKREVYIKALNSLNGLSMNTYMIFLEDQLMNYVLYRTANSYYFLNKIGYYFLRNSMSTTNNIFKIPQSRMHFIFIFLKYLFENSKNTKYERDMANMLFTYLNKGFNLGQRLNSLSGNFAYYKDIVDKYLNSTYITSENKYMLEDFKSIIERKNRSFAEAEAKRKKMNMNMTTLNTTNQDLNNTINKEKENIKEKDMERDDIVEDNEKKKKNKRRKKKATIEENNNEIDIERDNVKKRDDSKEKKRKRKKKEDNEIDKLFDMKEDKGEEKSNDETKKEEVNDEENKSIKDEKKKKKKKSKKNDEEKEEKEEDKDKEKKEIDN